MPTTPGDRPHIVVRGRASQPVEQDRVELTVVAEETAASRERARATVLAAVDEALRALASVEHRTRQVMPMGVRRVEIDKRSRSEQRKRPPERDDLRFEYRASKSIHLRYTIEGARLALDALARLDAVEVRWPHFELSRGRRREARARLLAEAVEDAQQTARTLAEAAGQTLGGPWRIDEAQVQDATDRMPFAYPVAAGAIDSDEAPPTPDVVEPGYTTVEASLLVTYRI